ncbi:MAG: hypothetical protein ACK40A_17875, partial [Pannonibacter indicus]
MASVAAPVITVNGTVIPASRIAAEAQNHPAASGRPGDAWRAAARALAIRQLLLDEALRRGVAAAAERTARAGWSVGVAIGAAGVVWGVFGGEVICSRAGPSCNGGS